MTTLTNKPRYNIAEIERGSRKRRGDRASWSVRNTVHQSGRTCSGSEAGGGGGGWKSSASTEISIFRTCIDRVHDGEHVYREIAIASCNRLISPPLSLRFLPDFHLPSTAGLLINEELPRPLDSIRIARITSSIFYILYSLSEFIFTMSRRQEFQE